MNYNTIYKLSKILNDANLTWGIGGSALLEYHGLYSNPNDLDIWIAPDDIPIAKDLFRNFEHIKTNIYLPDKYHFKIQYFDIEVDFVACFMIKPNQHEFTFNISPENLKYIKKDGINIPITFLEDWYIIYKLLKREDKAKIIEKYFLDNSIELSITALKLSLSNKNNVIPINTIKSANNLMQLSLFNSTNDYDHEQEYTHNIYLFDIPVTTHISHFENNKSNTKCEQLSFFDLSKTS